MIEGLKPYAEYKESGVPWLGRYPAHWIIKRGKSYLTCVDERSNSGREELLTVSSARGVVPRNSAKVTMFKAESYAGYKLCWPNDLVINSLWAWGGGLGVAQHHGIISTAYSVYRPRPSARFNPRFLHELVRSSAFNWELQVRSKGVWTSRLQLTDTAFLDAPIPLPPPEEQAAIVRFLDHANRKINGFVRAKRKLLALLGEQKQAIIHRAITRGLNPTASLKPSGIPWLGDIPTHWTRSRLKFEASHIVDCLHATPTYQTSGIYPAIRTADIEPGKVRLEQARKISLQEFQRWIARLRPERGDILYSREGERFGIAANVPADTPLCISQRMMVFRIRRRQNSEYLMWQLNCQHVYLQASLYVIGSTAPHVNVDQIQNFLLAIPPLDEQREIVEHIRAETLAVDTAIARTEREISLMQEYRTRLTADVVTGKLDVRESAAILTAESQSEIDISYDDLGAADLIEEIATDV